MSAPRPTPKPRDIATFRERRAWQREDRAYRKWAGPKQTFEPDMDDGDF